MTKSQAIVSIASEIILWQSMYTKLDVYDFNAAKCLAEHLLDRGCELEVFMPYESLGDYDVYRGIDMYEEPKDE